MAQKPAQLVYKETEEAIINAINNALNAGLPMFVLEPMLKIIYNEAQTQSNQQYQTQLQQYQAEIEAELKQEAAYEDSST